MVKTFEEFRSSVVDQEGHHHNTNERWDRAVLSERLDLLLATHPLSFDGGGVETDPPTKEDVDEGPSDESTDSQVNV